MNFIKLHLPDNNGFTWVNMEHVHEIRSDKKTMGSTLYFIVSVGDEMDYVTVTESPEDIMKMI